MKKRNKLTKQKAFTLIELIIAMAIIALLTGLTIRTFGTVQNKSRDSKRKQDLLAISKAFEMYYNDMGNYPLAAGGLIMGCGENSTEACQWGDIFQNTSNDTLYMAELPTDPGGNQYFYLADSEGVSYQLFAFLENEDDGDAAIDLDEEPAFYEGSYCVVRDDAALGNSCNYIFKSSNLTVNPTVLSNNLID